MKFCFGACVFLIFYLNLLQFGEAQHDDDKMVKCPLGEEYKLWSRFCETCKNCNQDCHFRPKFFGCYCVEGYCRDDENQRCHRCDGDMCPMNEEFYLWNRLCEKCSRQYPCQHHCTGVPKTSNCYCETGFCRNRKGECVTCYPLQTFAADTAIITPCADEEYQGRGNRQCESCDINCYNMTCKYPNDLSGCFCRRFYCRKSAGGKCERCPNTASLSTSDAGICPFGEVFKEWHEVCDLCANCDIPCRWPKVYGCYCANGYCRDPRANNKCRRCHGDKCPTNEKFRFWNRACDPCSNRYPCQHDCIRFEKRPGCYCDEKYCRYQPTGDCSLGCF